MKAIIHATGVPWQNRYLEFFRAGFAAHGIETERCIFDRVTPGDIHVLFGPNYWRNCEKKYKNYLQVNRKFIGDVNDDVAIGWNGFNGRGQFCVDELVHDRFENALDRSPIKIHPWRGTGERNFLLLGQADLGRCENYPRLAEWYKRMSIQYAPARSNFRSWPRGAGVSLLSDVQNSGFSVSLNSTVAVETFMLGHPTAVWDKGSPLWSICNPIKSSPEKTPEPHRLAVLEYLANCQYHYTEIQSGQFWQQLGGGPKGPLLCDVQFHSRALRKNVLASL